MARRAEAAATAAVLAACLGLAVLSLALSSWPHYDAWGWLVWGREIADPGLELRTIGGPAWKPLPVLFTTIFAPLGAPAAPALWLVVVRTGGLLALVAAFRLGARLGGVGAGVLAAALLALTQSWLLDLSWAEAEPLMVAAVLWAILVHLSGHRSAALLLGLGAALVRPEAWPFLGLYAVWAWRRRAAPRWLVALVVLAVPLLWLGPDWYSTGDPLTGSRLAKAGGEARAAQHAADPALDTLGRIGSVLSIPAWVLAGVGAILGARGRHGTVALALAAAAVGWFALVALMALAGYAGLGRFALPACAVACVLAGVGVSGLVGAARSRPLAVVVALALAGAAAPFLARSAGAAVADVRAGSGGRPIVAALEHAIARAGGAPRLRALGRPVVNRSLGTTLAWELRVPMRRVGDRTQRGRSVVFAAVPPSSYTGATPFVRPGPGVPRLLGTAGPWTVTALVAPARASGGG